ncbi:MAG TPA: hypothetical protein VLJ60_03050, partial [bacterium]|nr:hypothetical protein [bacterium]
MRKIVMFFIFLVPFMVFSDLIEVVPRPVNNIVGTDKIVVRGDYDSVNSEIRIAVSQNGNVRYYSPVILRTELNGYYVHGVELFDGSNTIKLERKTLNGWTGNIIATKAVTYSSTGPDAEESLWGRIANDGIHKNEEQRSIFYFGGPREVAGSQTVFENEGSTILLPRTRLLNNFNAQNIFLFSTNPLLSDFFSKKIFDTRGPSEINTPFDRYEWKTKNDVERIFQEINDANVNIIKLSWWGDFNDSFLGSLDNFDGTTFAPTFPVTCDLILNASDYVCVKHNYSNYEAGNDVRTSCNCCEIDEDCANDELCGLHGCLKQCNSKDDCADPVEDCVSFPGKTQKLCFNYNTSCRSLL